MAQGVDRRGREARRGAVAVAQVRTFRTRGGEEGWREAGGGLIALSWEPGEGGAGGEVSSGQADLGARWTSGDVRAVDGWMGEG